MSTEPPNLDFSIERLLRADCFPHEVGNLAVLETHISWVILTGKFAYKIKKPVKFDFVDYSTLELRRFYCQQELELNRRLAPNLYLDVVPIHLVDGQYLVGCASQEIAVTGTLNSDVECPIEYAVKMREFPQSSIVAARIDHPNLSSRTVENFGVELANFHEEIESADLKLDCVQIEVLRTESSENFSALQTAFAGDSRAAVIARLESWNAKQFESLIPIFNQRLLAGKIRRCHGDLHLKNIIQLEDGRLMAFDGIEFNEEFQWIDVINEIAFPTMDFFACGRPDLGWHLLNAYFEAAGDYEGLRVLRHYLVYRALVRAKVTWLNPAHHSEATQKSYQADPDEFDLLAGPWDKYLKAAVYFAFEIQPLLAITHGLSGSGKSTKVMQIIEQSGGIRIRSDVERRRLTIAATTKQRYSPEFSERVYALLLKHAESSCQAGIPVYLDATFLQRRERIQFADLARKLHVKFEIVDCEATFDELCQRIQHRIGDPSEATIEVLKLQMENRDPLTVDEMAFVLK